MVGCVSLIRIEVIDSYEMNVIYGKLFYFCSVFFEEEIKGGNLYIMIVELINVIGKDGDVNYGYLGVMYNVID